MHLSPLKHGRRCNSTICTAGGTTFTAQRWLWRRCGMQGTATARFSWQRQLAFWTTMQHCWRISSRARQLVKYLICSAQLCAGTVAAEVKAEANLQATTVIARMVPSLAGAMDEIFGLASKTCRLGRQLDSLGPLVTLICAGERESRLTNDQ